jgi:hypothetical protein
VCPAYSPSANAICSFTAYVNGIGASPALPENSASEIPARVGGPSIAIAVAAFRNPRA